MYIYTALTFSSFFFFGGGLAPADHTSAAIRFVAPPPTHLEKVKLTDVRARRYIYNSLKSPVNFTYVT